MLRRGRSGPPVLWFAAAMAMREVGAWRVRFPAGAITDAADPTAGADRLDRLDRAGPLAGATVAVKDMFAVAGQRVGAGNPTVLAGAPVEPAHSAAVRALLDAGAVLAGIARTDDLAFSIAGHNQHEGAVANPVRPGFLVGGSSSGPAAAVAGGEADLGLGTDTAGSIRVPASYCGLWGLRTTHGSVDVHGMRPLAPSFDAVGVLARAPGLLAAAVRALGADPDDAPVRRIVVPEPLLDLVTPTARAPFLAAVRTLAERQGSITVTVTAHGWDRDELRSWLAAFRALQAHEAWLVNRDLLRVEGAVSPDVRQRLLAGQDVDPVAHRPTLTAAAAALRAHLDGDTVLGLPSTSGTAPPSDADGRELQAVRDRTLQLTVLASLAGLPALSAPLITVRGAPWGLGLVGAPGDDLRLIRLAAAA
jgi:amidase